MCQFPQGLCTRQSVLSTALLLCNEGRNQPQYNQPQSGTCPLPRPPPTHHPAHLTHPNPHLYLCGKVVLIHLKKRLT